MTTAIDMVPRKLPDGEYSHTGAWAWLRHNQLKHVGVDARVLCEKGRGIRTDWSEFDTVYLYHTMDFEPEHPYCINVFDGPAEHTAKHFERIIWPQHAHVKFISLDYPMPNYGYRCKRKLLRASAESKMSDYWRNVDWDAVQAKCDTITDWVLDPGVSLDAPFVGHTIPEAKQQIAGGLTHRWPRAVIGDSHAAAVYRPPAIVIRHDGRTLRGLIKKGIKREVADMGYDYAQLKELTCYWGNIDVRHHLCRELDPIAETKRLVADYVAELEKHDLELEVVGLLPIEDESRKLPSTGYFEGTPFYGSRAERQEVCRVFNAELTAAAEKHGWRFFAWPNAWYEADGVEYMNEFMERPRSVHLARKYYRWDLERDAPNPHLSAPKRARALLEF